MLNAVNNPILTLQLGILGNGQNSKGMCQGGKPGTCKLYTDVCLCCSTHTSGCMVDGLGATAALLLLTKYFHGSTITCTITFVHFFDAYCR